MNRVIPLIRKVTIRIQELFVLSRDFTQKKKLGYSESIKEIEFPFTTKIYENIEEKFKTRYDNAYFLFVEQMTNDQRYYRGEDLT